MNFYKYKIVMKKLLLGFILLFSSAFTFSQVEGTWKVAPMAGALGVGPTQGDISWWSNDEASLIERACFFDDKFVFNADGSFNNVMDNETWIEGWQGISPDQCNTPVYPHDGSNAATWTYDETAGTITLDGVGAHLGIPKVANGFELTDPSQAPASITYIVTTINATSMTLDISIGTGWWRFIFEKQSAAGEDATLSDLQVDGTTIDGFSPSIQNYTYGLPEGTVIVPHITQASPTDPDVTSVVTTQASAIPGDATVVVTAANGTTTLTYTVSYAIVIPLGLPITFDNEQIDYSLVDFGGTTSSIMADPSNPSNNVVETIKGDGAETWAGTTVGEPNGLATPVPFTAESTIMSVRVYSPAIGIPVLFKIEDSEDADISVETTSYSTVANEWEVLTFDFSNENPGTPPLDLSNTYNKPVIFFNFGAVGANETFYWDNIAFGNPTAVSETRNNQLHILQNPVKDKLTIINKGEIEVIKVCNLSGQSQKIEKISNNQYDVAALAAGVYTIFIIDNKGDYLVGKFLKH